MMLLLFSSLTVRMPSCNYSSFMVQLLVVLRSYCIAMLAMIYKTNTLDQEVFVLVDSERHDSVESKLACLGQFMDVS